MECMVEMTVEQLKTDPRFLALKDSHKVFLLCYLETHDRIIAANKAWKCSSESAARSLAGRVLKKVSVSRLIAECGGPTVIERMSKDDVVGVISTRLRLCSDDDKVIKYVDILSKLEGWYTKPAPAVPVAQEEDLD
jgi:hypothetical protein